LVDCHLYPLTECEHSGSFVVIRWKLELDCDRLLLPVFSDFHKDGLAYFVDALDGAENRDHDGNSLLIASSASTARL
jgi:hypothetical protein